MHHSGSALVDCKQIFDKVNLKSGMRIADFGCGRTGHIIFPASKVVGDEGIVYAVDIIQNVLQSIQSSCIDQGMNNIKTIWSDIERVGKTSIISESLDVSCLINVLSLLKNKQEAMVEASRVLQKNGLLVIIDWTKQMGPLGPKSDNLLIPDLVIRVAKECDLELVNNEAMNEYHYMLIFKKI